METKELEVLQALRTVLEYDQDLLSNSGHELYGQLSDKADEVNIVW